MKWNKISRIKDSTSVTTMEGEYDCITVCTCMGRMLQAQLTSTFRLSAFHIRNSGYCGLFAPIEEETALRICNDAI